VIKRLLLQKMQSCNGSPYFVIVVATLTLLTMFSMISLTLIQSEGASIILLKLTEVEEDGVRPERFLSWKQILYRSRGVLELFPFVYSASVDQFRVVKLESCYEMPQNNKTLLADEEAYYLEIYEKYQPDCSNRILLPRADGYGEDRSLEKRWSLQRESFLSLGQNRCATAQSVLDAVRFGRRVWKPDHALRNGNIDGLVLGNKNSYYVPYKCWIPYLSSTDACRTLNKFSTITVAGDSMTRHFVQTLWMILTENLACSGVRDLTLCPTCACDGIFSENAGCRLPTPVNVTLKKLCPGADFRYKSMEELPAQSTVFDDMCVKQDSLPHVFMIQGGTHYMSNVSRTVDEFVSPWLSKFDRARASCAKPFNVFLLFHLMTTQSPKLDLKYPHQSNARVIIFNELMMRELSPKGFIPMDFWNLTLNARSSDGLHFTTDVNLYKVAAFLEFLRLQADEIGSRKA